MPVIIVTDKNRIEQFLRQNPILHLYSLGDLDDFFWPKTRWYALGHEDRIVEIALLYSGGVGPTLIALASESNETMQQLLTAILPLQQGEVYAHLSVGLSAHLESLGYRLAPHGLHCRMALSQFSGVTGLDVDSVIQLGKKDLPAITALLAESYPGNWFDPRMLETGQYFGLYDHDELICMAGVHVFSTVFKVAAIGNVTTHPRVRGCGLATRVCAVLCANLLKDTTHIGLNVKADNHSAIACYRKLGFDIHSYYEEFEISPPHHLSITHKYKGIEHGLHGLNGFSQIFF